MDTTQEILELKNKILELENKLIAMEDSEIFSEKELDQKQKTFNGLSAREWASLSRSVWNDVSSVRGSSQLLHGATYPEKLCRRVISMYTKMGDTVLDPFLGTGSTINATIQTKRNGIGIELTQKYYETAVESANKTINECHDLFNLSEPNVQIIHGDCLTEIEQIANESVQLTLTSPPYADLIHKVLDDRENRHKKSAFISENNSTTNLYSQNDADFGNMKLPEYEEAVTKLMEKIYNKTKKGGYNVWVVKDYRDTRNNIPYVDLHTIIASCGQKAGFKYHDLIIWDQNEHRKLVLLGYPSKFYVNQNHTFLVVLRKPNNE